MAARESVKTKLNRLRWHSKQGEPVPVNASALLRWSEAGIHFLLASVLTGAAVFEEYAPFGVALVGAAGSGTCGAAALLGAFGGYLIQLGFADGLRYAAAAILTFAVSFAFYDVQALRRPWAMPLLTALLNGCTGFVYLSQEGWRTVDVIYFATELILCAAAGWCYRAAPGPHACRTHRHPLHPRPHRQPAVSVLLGAAGPGSGLPLPGYFPGPVSGGDRGLGGGLAGRLRRRDGAGHLGGTGPGSGRQWCAHVCHGPGSGRIGSGCLFRRAEAPLRAGLRISQRGLGPVDLGQGTAHFHFIRGVFRFGGLSPAAAGAPEKAGPGGSPPPCPPIRTRPPRQRTRRRLEDTAHAFRTLYETMRSSFRPPRNDNPCGHRL